MGNSTGPLKGLADEAEKGLFDDANGLAAGANPESTAGVAAATGATITDGSENGFVDEANGLFGASEPCGTIAGEASPSYDVTGAAMAANAGLSGATGGAAAA